jgi:signal transduction histidine kinase
MGGEILLGVAFLTTIAIYIASLISMPASQPAADKITLTVLFALFALSIYFYRLFFVQFWQRLTVVLFQIGLVFIIMLVGRGIGSLPILYFIIIPMIYLAFNFVPANLLALLCLIAVFIANLVESNISQAFSELLPYGGGFVFFAAVSMALMQQQKDRQRAEQLLSELEEAHKQLRAYAAQVEALAVAEERNRLAREIHDSLGHYLTAMTMQLQAAGKLIGGNPQRAAESIAKAEEMARQSLAEVRRSVAALRTSPVNATPLNDAMDALVQNLREEGLVVTFTSQGNPVLLPLPIKTALYRAAQEGLTNVRKHANASAVDVILVYQAEQVTLTVTDNGIGRRNQEQAGFGLLGLGERFKMVGGSVEASDRPEGGFRLHVAAPLWLPEQEDERED